MAAVIASTKSRGTTAVASVAGGAVKPALSNPFGGKKYRQIIIAVALFLLFDLGVLVLNFYTSYQIAEDAVGVNLSGRQRMLSQRSAKALLTVQAAKTKGLAAAQPLEELQLSTKLFDQSLKGFQFGATLPGGDGKPVVMQAAQGALVAEILAKTQAIWTPYQAVLAPVLGGNATELELRAAVDYVGANNLELLGLMNQLTTALEAVAAQRADTLRTVQTVGITLALLNFVFLLFKVLRRLRQSDAEIEAVSEENREILSSVREGLFLLAPDMRLGSQLSKSAQTLFGKPLQAGQSFFEVLKPLVSNKVLSEARDYADLLFAPHVKEQLVQGINPLSEVQITVTNRLGQHVVRHLSFQFNRVQDSGRIRHLLVTVQDVSPQVELQARLKIERGRSQKEFSMLLTAFETEPATMRSFVERTEASLLEINDLLRSISSVSSETQVLKTVDGAFRKIHAVKGDAASLGLDVVATLAHQFESELQKLRDGDFASGDVLLALPLPLEELLSKVAAFKTISARKTAASEGHAPQAAGTFDKALCRLANDVGSDCKKNVYVTTDTQGLTDLPTYKANQIRDIAVQLVRNAVVHGVEPPAQRSELGKAAAGQLQVALTREDNGEWQLAVCDDGTGINADHIRQKLLDLGWYAPHQLESFSDKQIIAHIFKPGFSTATAVANRLAWKHAGRGVGLDLVQTHVNSLGARLLLSTVPGQFTEFKVRFS